MWKFKKVVVTGGAGFIGSSLVRKLLLSTSSKIFNIDKLSYASDLSAIKKIDSSNNRHKHFKLDLAEDNLVELIKIIDPDIIFHLAAESHVDRSIESPSNFIKSNILGTYNLLDATRKHWDNLKGERKENFRFHHISTDEVFGSIEVGHKFNEDSKYFPNSPYSASKASSDHLVRSWNKTYGLPTLITNCSNNYGPYQFPEKLIPLVIIKALEGETIPIYGDGNNIRDWLHVEDHITALMLIAEQSKSGDYFCIGGNAEKTNLELVYKICELIDKRSKKKYAHKDLINFVSDRPGHDRRYAIDSSKLENTFNWQRKFTFNEGLENTVDWYLNNLDWCKTLMKTAKYNGRRIGLS